MLVVATKQIHASHNCIINGPLSLYRKNKFFVQKILGEKPEKLRNSRSF